jgi:hypothetical protein
MLARRDFPSADVIGPIRMRALNTSVLTMNPIKMRRTPSSSPSKNDQVNAETVESARDADESAERDQERRRYRSRRPRKSLRFGMNT